MSQRLHYEAVVPEAMKAFGGVSRTLAGLPKELVDMIFLRVSQINGCAYCIDTHHRDAVSHGVAERKLALLPAWREAGLFSSREAAALAWAEALTLVAETHAPDAAYAELAAQFSEREVGDLTIAISLMNAFNRIAIGFRKGPKVD